MTTTMYIVLLLVGSFIAGYFAYRGHLKQQQMIDEIEATSDRIAALCDEIYELYDELDKIEKQFTQQPDK